jgi:hypothetical protein
MHLLHASVFSFKTCFPSDITLLRYQPKMRQALVHLRQSLHHKAASWGKMVAAS